MADRAPERTLTVTCNKCGTSVTARARSTAAGLIRAARQAHDLLNPDCPTVKAEPNG